MDRRNATILGIILIGMFLSLFAFVSITIVALDSHRAPFFRGSQRDDSSGPAIGVIKVIGAIGSSDKTLEQLRKLTADKDVKALVVRLDSPGGAVGPSQEIYEELRRISEDIPVVCSMGSVAASGGYYIAAGCDWIFANKGTLTGSIGVISQIPYYGDIAKKLSLEILTIKAGANKDIGNSFRRMEPEERALMQSMLDQVHEQFITDIADGRGMDVEEIRPWADGRVLTGEAAQRLGLVDFIGGFNDAVRYAMDKAGLKGEPNLRTPKSEKRFTVMDMMSEGGEAISKGVIKGLTQVNPAEGSSLIGSVTMLPPPESAVSK